MDDFQHLFKCRRVRKIVWCADQSVAYPVPAENLNLVGTAQIQSENSNFRQQMDKRHTNGDLYFLKRNENYFHVGYADKIQFGAYHKPNFLDHYFLIHLYTHIVLKNYFQSSAKKCQEKKNQNNFQNLKLHKKIVKFHINETFILVPTKKLHIGE